MGYFIDYDDNCSIHYTYAWSCEVTFGDEGCVFVNNVCLEVSQP